MAKMLKVGSESARRALLEQFTSTCALTEHGVDVDRVWSNRQALTTVVAALVELLQDIDRQRPFTAIAFVDSPGRSVGAVPLAGSLSLALAKDIVVWKDLPSILSPWPHVSGARVVAGGSVLILYCLARQGHTASRVLETLQEKGFPVSSFFSIVDAEEGAAEVLGQRAKDLGIELGLFTALDRDEVPLPQRI